MQRRAGLALLVALGLSVAGCGASPSSSSTSSASSASVTSSASSASVTSSAPSASATSSGAAASYSLQLRKSFLASCDRTSNGKLAYCRCTLAHIEMSASQAKFEADVGALVKGAAALPRYLIAAEHACGA